MDYRKIIVFFSFEKYVDIDFVILKQTQVGPIIERNLIGDENDIVRGQILCMYLCINFCCYIQCTLITGAMLIQPGLKNNFFSTPCCILTTFCLGVKNSPISDFSPMHST